MAPHTVPPEHRNADSYTSTVIHDMLPEVSSRAEFCDVFCEKGVFSIEQSRRILTEAKKRGMALKIHADELSMSGGAELAAELEATSAEHLLHASDKGLKGMAEKGVIAVLLPAVPMSLLSTRYADARRIIELGVPVALGTDFNPNCWVESMQSVISLACYQMRMKPEEAISASTINAAYAVNRGNLIGSLEPGKKADIIILNAPNYIHIPYRMDGNLVRTVIKNGNVVVH